MRKIMASLVIAAIATGLVGFGLGNKPGVTRAAEKTAPDPAAVERTRETVRMLDDAYKGVVVFVTATYVGAQEKTPAATVAHKVFKYMEEKGHGRTRLIDATGQPMSKSNAAKTEFEKKAVQELKAGKTYYEEVATRDGKPVLRAATPVPVVMKQCITCHESKKEGDLLGALVYELPIK